MREIGAAEFCPLAYAEIRGYGIGIGRCVVAGLVRLSSDERIVPGWRKSLAVSVCLGFRFDALESFWPARMDSERLTSHSRYNATPARFGAPACVTNVL